MNEVPSGYAEAIAPGNMVVQRFVDLRLDSDLTQPPDYFGIPLAAGSVTIDSELTPNGGGFHRVSGRLTVVDEDSRFDDPTARLTPLANNRGWTSPYGTTARVTYGVQVPGYTGFFGDDFFYQSVGTGRLGENMDDGLGELDVPFYDLAEHVSRSKFTAPYIIPAGQNYGDAIIAGVQSRLAINMNADAIVVSTDATTPLIVIDPEQDPWAEFEAMAASIGYVLYFDLAGAPTLIPRPDPSTADPVRSFIHGRDAIVAVSRSLSDDPGYNGVVMRADSSVLPAPLVTVLWDEDADSPTYHLGPYGERPFTTSSPYIANQAQCDDAAAAMLTAVLGLTEQVALSCLPDPALRVNDVVYVYRERRGIPVIDGNYVIQSLTLPQSLAEPMTIQARRQRAGL